jgi:hypothetical protein
VRAISVQLNPSQFGEFRLDFEGNSSRISTEAKTAVGSGRSGEAAMLPPFIIEQIRRREEEQRRRQDDSRPRVQLPIEQRPMGSEEAQDADDDPNRGVVIVDLMG